jgi:hypothetical protein
MMNYQTSLRMYPSREKVHYYNENFLDNTFTNPDYAKDN